MDGLLLGNIYCKQSGDDYSPSLHNGYCRIAECECMQVSDALVQRTGSSKSEIAF